MAADTATSQVPLLIMVASGPGARKRSSGSRPPPILPVDSWARRSPVAVMKYATVKPTAAA